MAETPGNEAHEVLLSARYNTVSDRALAEGELGGTMRLLP
jgi:hypothetical protein